MKLTYTSDVPEVVSFFLLLTFYLSSYIGESFENIEPVNLLLKKLGLKNLHPL